MIISTPTGSTGYAYSAGGKILPLNSKKIELVPICPYKRAFQTSTAGENTEISMSCDRSSSLIIDGIFIRKLKHGEMVKVKKDKALVFLE
jgi:NAD+ kinase